MGLSGAASLAYDTATMQHIDAQNGIMMRQEQKNRLQIEQSNKTADVMGKADCKRSDLDRKYEQISKTNPITDENDNASFEPDTTEGNLTTQQSIAKLKEDQKIDNEEQSLLKVITDAVQRLEKFIDQMLQRLDLRQQVTAEDEKTWKEVTLDGAGKNGYFDKSAS